jgi:hypothetical protein
MAAGQSAGSSVTFETSRRRTSSASDSSSSTSEPVLSTFDPDRWAAERQYRRQDPHLALDCFLRARRATLAALRALAPSQWERGGQHSLRGFMTVRRIVHGWAKHDTEHITQIGLLRRNWS